MFLFQIKCEINNVDPKFIESLDEKQKQDLKVLLENQNLVNQGQGRILHVEKRNVRQADNGKFIVSDVSD